jgi:hypothetical protein
MAPDGPSGTRWTRWLRRDRITGGLYGMLVVAVLLVSFHVHRQAGLTLPNPWNDEAWNLWPAKALVETGSFLTPELNPERPTMLYGGGYAAAVGLYMRLFGFSLETARGFSWVALAGAWLFTAGMIRRLPWRLPLLAVAGLFFLGPAHVVAGNMARPDALALLLVTLGYWWLAKEQPVKAVFVCGLGVIIHPVALYFLLGALGYVGTSPALWRTCWPLKRSDWAVVAICTIPVLLSAWMIGSIWEWFYHDFFVVGLSHNLTYDPLAKLSGFRWWLLWMGAMVVAGRRWSPPAAAWALYGAVALLASLMGGEMWYDLYKMTGFMVMLTGGTALLVHAGRAAAARWPRRQPFLAAAAAAVAVAYLAGLGHLTYRHGFITGPRNYPQKLSWGWGMTMPDPEVPYITEADKQSVAALAMAVAGDHPAPLVEFPATGDSFLFVSALPPPARPLLRIRTEVDSQVVVFHLSRYIPDWVQKSIRRQMDERGIDPGDPDLVRDGTEKWYVRRAP